MKEDKQKICMLLYITLQNTRGASDLLSLDYDPVTEIVTAQFAGGGKKQINVECDSGTAMIRNIVNNLEY